MGQFAYGFSLTLLHSLWQAALLLLIYSFLGFLLKKHIPSVRRNALYILLVTQLLLSVVTFIIYYSGAENLYQPLLALNYDKVFTGNPLFYELTPLLLLIYALVIAYKSISLVYHWNKFKSNCRRTWIKPPIDLKVFTTLKSYELGIKRKVSLWYSNAISTPVTFGFFKPVIYE